MKVFTVKLSIKKRSKQFADSYAHTMGTTNNHCIQTPEFYLEPHMDIKNFAPTEMLSFPSQMDIHPSISRQTRVTRVALSKTVTPVLFKKEPKMHCELTMYDAIKPDYCTLISLDPNFSSEFTFNSIGNNANFLTRDGITPFKKYVNGGKQTLVFFDSTFDNDVLIVDYEDKKLWLGVNEGQIYFEFLHNQVDYSDCFRARDFLEISRFNSVLA